MASLARPSLCRQVAALGGNNVAPLRFGPAGAALRIRGTESREKGKIYRSGFCRAQSSIASVSNSSSNSSSSTQSSQFTAPPPESPKPPPAPKSRRITRTLLFLTLTVVSLSAGFAMTASTVISDSVTTATDLVDPPSDEETLTLFVPPTSTALEIETQIFEHPLTKSLFSDPKFIASRPHLKIPEKMRAQNLMAGPLLGSEKIEVPPLQFATADGSEFVSLQYLGPSLCGHPGIVHGGLLATLLDEGTARCCFPALPNKVAVTASLKIDYKKPVWAGQIVVLRAVTEKVEGRKAWVRGWLETLADESKGEKPVVLTEAESLFIEPRGADKMKRIVPI